MFYVFCSQLNCLLGLRKTEPIHIRQKITSLTKLNINQARNMQYTLSFKTNETGCIVKAIGKAVPKNLGQKGFSDSYSIKANLSDC